MSLAAHDLTDEELRRIATRLSRLFKARDVWPFLGFQYRVGEVGKNRIEPRELRRALAELSNNRRPRRGKLGEAGPWEPIPGIFASPLMSLEEAHEAATSLVDQVEPLVHLDRADVLDRLRVVMEVATGTFIMDEDEGSTPAEEAAFSIRDSAFSQTKDLSCRRWNVTMWLTHEAEWLYPDDPNLWAFLSRCIKRSTRPLIVARHIHRATFALFRLLEARGVQYYSMLVPEETYTDLAEIAQEIGWAHIRRVEDVADHPVIEQIHASVRHFQSNPASAVAREAIEAGIRSGLPINAGPQELLSWAQETHMEIGSAWETTVKRWGVWAGYRTPRRLGLPSGGIQAILEKLPGGTSHGLDSLPATQEPTPPQGEAQPTADGEHWTFGRDTKVSRVPIRLR